MSELTQEEVSDSVAKGKLSRRVKVFMFSMLTFFCITKKLRIFTKKSHRVTF